MSLNELQLWLLNEGVSAELKLITRLTVRSEFDNLTAEPFPITVKSVDWPRLILAGSILARSENRDFQEAALRIATGALYLSDAQPIKDGAAILLEKLANYRTLDLAFSRHLVESNLYEKLGVSLRLESQRREIENSVLIQSTGTYLHTNNFQRKFWEQASKKGWLSASAPTASGKTFLVLRWLLDQISTNDIRVAVYLAPTRALVTEIETSLRSSVASYPVQVLSLPIKEKYKAALQSNKKIILVFTQERLHFFANILKQELRVDLLIVDEAHKIGDNQRGIIMQDAIERISRNNSTLKAVFISPATENPEELLVDAPQGIQKTSVKSEFSTVLQNLIFAKQVPGNSKLWKLHLLQNDHQIEIGNLKLRSAPLTIKKRLAFIAAAIGERGGTLVYTNGAGEAEDVAALLSQLVPSLQSIDRELLDLAELARKGVHQDYRLAPLLEQGIAFHYGNMPSLLRLEIERLFRSAKIRFLVCTSTLIEGVNLSCRTIIVRGPRKGKGNPMEPHDFWNLAGRAGRWGFEFQGNIICVDPDNLQAWPTGVPKRANYPIQRESDAVIAQLGEFTRYLTERASIKDDYPDNGDKYEQVGAYLLTTFLRSGSLSSSSLIRRHEEKTITELEIILRKLAAPIEIDADLASRHPGISAIGLQRLLNAFSEYEGNVENLLIADVASHDSFDRYITIMRRINKHLFPAFLPESRIPLYALIISKWLRGYSLARIISENIEWHRSVGRRIALQS